MRYTNLYLIFIIFAAGCGQSTDSADRQEIIDRLRVFGTATTPLIATLSKEGAAKTVDIDVYAAVPLGIEATIESYTLATTGGSSVSLAPEDVTIDPTKFSYTDYATFRLLKATLTVKVPLESKFSTPAAPEGAPTSSTTTTGTTTASVGGDVNFGLKLMAGGKEVTMTSAFAARAEGSSDLSWVAPTIDSITPADQTSVAKNDVKLSMTNTGTNDRRVTYGWFVTGGEIANRRAQSTTWQPRNSGNFTLVGILHGQTTRGFAIKVVNITVP